MDIIARYAVTAVVRIHLANDRAAEASLPSFSRPTAPDTDSPNPAAVSGSAAFCTASAISREASAPIGVISAADFVPPVSVRSVTSTGVSASFSPAARPTAARAISYTPKKCFISAAAQHSAQAHRASFAPDPDVRCASTAHRSAGIAAGMSAGSTERTIASASRRR